MKKLVKWFKENINGVSVGVAGLQWVPTASEKNAVRKLLIYLDDRRVICDPPVKPYGVTLSHIENPKWVTSSLIEIRGEITKCLQEADFGDEAYEIIDKLRQVCREWLDQPDSFVIETNRGIRIPSNVTNLDRVRFSFAKGVESLAKLYEVSLPDNLEQLSTRIENQDKVHLDNL
ncbi:DUF6650 family protein [Pseudoalteromonas sp. HF66]|uniref:DUF6650 family protein n=1 Tax=Pseudoalteromonas sp. HF66 TaxID=2721559 RepID=UPI00142FA319|nr:DUF6650 family protein [Pseudoalteromonas sp. HF66]NIZ07217.1 hypothetical protein [Pseudoalteromonas sp. HF66]